MIAPKCVKNHDNFRVYLCSRCHILLLYSVHLCICFCFWVGGVGSELWQRMQGRGMERKDNSKNKIVAKSLLTVRMGVQVEFLQNFRQSRDTVPSGIIFLKIPLKHIIGYFLLSPISKSMIIFMLSIEKTRFPSWALCVWLAHLCRLEAVLMVIKVDGFPHPSCLAHFSK